MAVSKAPEQTNTIHVLHVDDDAATLEISRQILLDIDPAFIIEDASCVDEAFTKLSSKTFDVVVSDYEMPQKDGLQFLKELREQNNKIPFILFTGKGREDVAVKALNLGARGYYNKQGSPETVYGELSHGIRMVAETAKVKNALLESEKRYRTILEQAAEAIFIHDRNGQVLDVNLQACKSLGYTKEELLKMRIADISPAAAVEGDVIWPKVLSGQTFTFDGTQKRKDGSVFYVEICLNPITIGNETLIIAFARDIDERRKAEKEMENLKEFNESVINSIAEVLLVIDPSNYKILAVNGEAEKELKLTKEELIGKTCYEATHNCYSPCEEPHTCPLQEALKTGKVATANHVHFDSNKNKIDVEISVYPYTNIKGEITRIVHLARNVTAQKKAEEELKIAANAFDLATDAILVLDLDGKIIKFNEMTCNLYGYSKEELEKMSLQDIDTAETAVQIESRMKVLLEKGSAVFETEQVRKDKTIVPTEIHARLIESDGKKLIISVIRDISERRKNEKDIKMAANLFNLANDSIFVVDLEGNIVDFNETAYKVRGYTKEEMAKMRIQDLDLPEYSALFKNRNKILLEKGSAVFESVHVCKDGTLLPIEIHARIIDMKGKEMLLSVARDISERKKTEKALKESEEKHRKLFEGSLDAIFLADAQTGMVIDCNPAALELVGREKSELIGQHQRILHPPYEIEGDAAKVFKKHQKQEGINESQIITKTGEIKDVSIKANLFEMGGRKVLQGVFRDITEQKRAEEKLRISEQHVRQAQCVAHTGDWDWNVKTGGLVWGEETFRIFGFPLDMVPSVEKFLDRVHPDDRAFVKQSIDDALKGKPYNIDMRIIRPDGTLRVANATGEVEYDKQGNPVRMFGMFQEITERKKAEEKLNQTLNQLALVNEKLAVIGSLTRHDVSNKLAAVAGYAYLMKKKNADQPEVVAGLSKIEQAVKDSEKIFKFAKLYESLGIEELKYVDVDKVVNEALAIFSERSFNVVNQCMGLQVLADSFLRQMFYNFLDNTKKYGKKTTTVNIRFQLNSSGLMELIYEDDGMGIPIENKVKLFSEGFSTGGSSGFGLFFIGKMMDIYGWQIQEVGEPGKGAKFLITIPKENQNGKNNFRLPAKRP